MFTNQSESDCSALAGSLFKACVSVYTLFLPFLIFVLFVGFQQFRSKTSATSNFDVFIINTTTMEILSTISIYVFVFGYFSKKRYLQTMGRVATVVAFTGQTFFQDLICVDRYLAVVYPIIYLHLKKRDGVKVRIISVGCTWVVSIVLAMGEYFAKSMTLRIICFILQPAVSILVVCFCTASVLCVLIRPRPGEVGGDRRAIDQSKRKAFYTMTTTLGVLLSRFTVLLLSYMLAMFPVPGMELSCTMFVSKCALWFALPCSLVLPLLFLKRAGKLPKWK